MGRPYFITQSMALSERRTLTFAGFFDSQDCNLVHTFVFKKGMIEEKSESAKLLR